MKRDDIKYMRVCLRLAIGGEGFVSPNPMVGCVIVNKGEIVGTGFHPRYGGPHAEQVALRRAGRKAMGATLYVNLEPCVHYGKTPPCVDAIIAAGVREVVVAHIDPNPLVHGKGLRRLRRAGVRVRSGILEDTARALNERFVTAMTRNRPFVTVKVAQTLDGRMADVSGTSRWITAKAARAASHRLRSLHDAVLVGAGTVIKDDPELTVRLVKGRNPVRVVLDGKLDVPLNRRIFQTKEAQAIVITSAKALRQKERKSVRLERKGVAVLGVEGGFDLRWAQVVRLLHGIGLTSVLVEGGSATIREVLKRGPVDRIHCFVAPKILGGGLPSFALEHPLPLGKALSVRFDRFEVFDGDVHISGRVLA